MTRPVLLGCLWAALLLGGPGCGVFKSSTSQGSSESSSDSVSSPFRWSSHSSGSSSPAEESARDVRDATESFALRGGDAESFRRDVSRIAESHGVTDWESDPLTYEAIGRGLCRAGVDGADLDRLQRELAGGDGRALAWIESGFASEAVR